MEDIKVRHFESTPYNISSSKNSSGKSFGSFQHNLEDQTRQNFKKRISDLFDELKDESENILINVNLQRFEKYRILISQLLSEVISNAFLLKADLITDYAGNRRVLTLINVIDSKLDEMAEEVLKKNSTIIDYISRVDEIRGLIMDMLC